MFPWSLAQLRYALELAPVGRPIAFKPGQFGFLKMKEDGLREPHPFTIASARTSDSSPGCNVHFVIRVLGDYTQRLLKEAAVGMHADVYAPYGRFERERQAKQEIWIAGGVGITPFIAWLKDAKAGELGNVLLIYFFTPGREFPSAAELQALAAERGARFIAVAGSPTDTVFTRLFKDKLKEAGAENISVRFCGPTGLLDEIRILMRENQIPESRLRYEFFEFRQDSSSRTETAGTLLDRHAAVKNCTLNRLGGFLNACANGIQAERQTAFNVVLWLMHYIT